MFSPYAYVSHDNQFLEVTVSSNFRNLPILYNLATGDIVEVYDKVFRRGSFWRDEDTRIIALKDNAIIAQEVATGDILYSISSTGAYDVMGDVIVAELSVDCVTADYCYELQVFDANTGDERFTTSHDNVNDVFLYSVIQDRKYLLAASRDVPDECPTCQSALYLWSLDTGDLLHTFDYDGWIDYGAGEYDLNHDETLLLTHSINDIKHNIVKLWDIETGQSTAQVDLGDWEIGSVQFDRSGQHFIIHSGNRVEIYDIATTNLQHSLTHPSVLNDITVLHDEQKIASHSLTDFTLWEVVDWQPTLINFVETDIYTKAYNQDKSQLITWLGSDNFQLNAYIWDVETGQLVLTLETETTVNQAIWSPDEKRIVVLQDEPNCDIDCTKEILVFDTTNGEHLATYDSVGGSSSFLWYPDTHHLIDSTRDSMQILDIDTGDRVYISDEYAPAQQQWNSDYSLFAVPDPIDFSLSIIDYPSADIIQNIPLSVFYFNTHWVNYDQIIVLRVQNLTNTTFADYDIVSGKKDLVGYDVASGEEAYRIVDAGTYQISHDRTQIMILTKDNQLEHIDAATGQTLWTSEVVDEGWTSIIWSPDDSKIILSSFYVGQAKIFDVETGEELKVFPYSDLSWSPDSQLILIFDDNVEQEVWRIYDVEADQMRFSFQPSSTPVWKPNSRGLVSHDGRWSADFGGLINRGKEHQVRDLTELELLEFFIKSPPDKSRAISHIPDNN
jgi:WD40 repeat protein